MNRAQRATRDDQQQHATLPANMQRSDVEKLLTLCASSIGLSSAHLRCLIVMIHHTRPGDWTSSECDPICFAAQTTIADTLCISTRAVRSAERKFESLGLAARDVGAGGGRGRWGDFSLGINFAPLVERIEDLRQINDARDAERRRSQVLRHQISAARRLAKDAISSLLEADPRNAALPELLQSMSGLPRRYADLATAALDELLAQVETLYRAATALLSGSDESAARSEQNFRPHIQDTSDEITCSCSDAANDMRTRGKPREDDFVKAAPAGAEEGFGIKPAAAVSAHKAKTYERFNPYALYRAASPDFRTYIDAYAAGKTPDVLVFSNAAALRRPDLGISPSAWDEAIEEMGVFAAALSLLVIDARRFDPVRPIRSPGGMLRAFTAHHRAGTLNLSGSLIALINRAYPGTDETPAPESR